MERGKRELVMNKKNEEKKKKKRKKRKKLIWELNKNILSYSLF